ncbi:LpxI family protein [Terrarubrum flagellatum]|uniref:LpxI family protein n=1 Tax=Terrirubrum flagellatum TaxID=2895980 RepID=UPI00314514EA
MIFGRPSAESGREGPIGVLCFGGDLPLAVAEATRARGRDVFTIGFRGHAGSEIERFPHAWVKLGQIGRFFRLVRQHAIRRIIIVGAITRPALRDLSLDWRGVWDIPRIVRMLRGGGDDNALRAIIAYFEENGLTVLGISEIAPELLAAAGDLGSVRLSEDERANAAIGLAVLDALSPFDAGQACVVIDGRPVAIEGAEGTDAMIARVAEMRANGRLRLQGRCGVLVKAAKKGQDLRVDLPTIGPRTIENALAAQLAGVAVESGKSLIADRENCLATADRAGIAVVGLSRA